MTFDPAACRGAVCFAMDYVPRVRRRSITGRPLYSVLHIVEGEYRYRFAGGELTLRAGDDVFLPKGAVYDFEIADAPAHALQIEFELSGFPATVSVPVRLDGGTALTVALRTVVENHGREDLRRQMLCRSAFYQICAYLPFVGVSAEPSRSRIRPAVEYIEAHAAERIDLAALARLCCMSESQMRRLFRRELGVSPVTYKNCLRIDRAKSMILYGDCNISQAAQAVGFDNVYEFSSMFKKQVGVSPSRFAENRPAAKP